MRNILIALAIVLSACGPSTPDKPDADRITGACVRSFRPTLDAWESANGRVPGACAYLDGMVDVVLASADEMPCDEPIGVNEVRTGCFAGGTIYVNVELDEIQRVDASVHEWVHALAGCADGDFDFDHLRAGLWAVYGAETVEIQAQASTEIGQCL